jgi:hypothetical protein
MAPVFGPPSLETRDAAPGQVSGALRKNGTNSNSAFSPYRGQKQGPRTQSDRLCTIGTFRPVAEIVRDLMPHLAVEGKL